MEKLIIEVHDELDPRDALGWVSSVMAMGRISGAEGREQYCYVTTFGNQAEVRVIAHLNEKSDRFVVRRSKFA